MEINSSFPFPFLSCSVPKYKQVEINLYMIIIRHQWSRLHDFITKIRILVQVEFETFGGVYPLGSSPAGSISRDLSSQNLHY